MKTSIDMNLTITRPAVRILGLVLVLITTNAKASEDETREYTGCFTCCFESGFFNPTPNPEENIWFVAEAPKELMAKVTAITANDKDYIARLKVLARLGPIGRFGHMGMAQRKMYISEVIELQESSNGRPACDTLPLLDSPPPENGKSPPTQR